MVIQNPASDNAQHRYRSIWDKEITDIHLHSKSIERSLLFPGPVLPPPDLLPELNRLLENVKGMGTDFLVEHSLDSSSIQIDGKTIKRVFLRGRQDKTAVDGVWYRMRKMPVNPPVLDKLKYPLSKEIQALLLHPHLLKGGLVYITGAPGSGKTTTCSASLVARLQQYGGFAYTVEDPPEQPLNGWHGKGYCSQNCLSGSWSDSFRGVVRSQPAQTPCILYVGEVRDAEGAQALIHAASSGFLVFATGFGTNVVTSLDALCKQGSTARDPLHTSLANVLRLVVHQDLTENGMQAKLLAIRDPSDQEAINIRNGDFNRLDGSIQQQCNRLMNGADLFGSEK